MESDKKSSDFPLAKKEIISRRTLAKSVEKTKLENELIQSQLGFILASLYNCLVISTRGCCSHSWKSIKSPICSQVQLIPYSFWNRSGFPIQIARIIAHQKLLPY